MYWATRLQESVSSHASDFLLAFVSWFSYWQDFVQQKSFLRKLNSSFVAWYCFKRWISLHMTFCVDRRQDKHTSLYNFKNRGVFDSQDSRGTQLRRLPANELKFSWPIKANKIETSLFTGKPLVIGKFMLKTTTRAWNRVAVGTGFDGSQRTVPATRKQGTTWIHTTARNGKFNCLVFRQTFYSEQPFMVWSDSLFLSLLSVISSKNSDCTATFSSLKRRRCRIQFLDTNQLTAMLRLRYAELDLRTSATAIVGATTQE